jgi:dCMP deaminase
MSPCINCAKVIVNSGIREVKYLEEYRDTSGVDLLLKAGIVVGHIIEGEDD